MAYLLQQLANAVPLAALYAALAFGYSIAFGVTRRADITYGALFAFSGQMLLLFTDFGYSRLFLILPAALLLRRALFPWLYAMGAGLLIGRGIMMPLVRKSPNTVIVAALGMTIVLRRPPGSRRTAAISGCRRCSTMPSSSGATAASR